MTLHKWYTGFATLVSLLGFFPYAKVISRMNSQSIFRK